jgi:hypothetical protein
MAARQGPTTREPMHRLGNAPPAMALRYQRAEEERDAILAAAMSAALRHLCGTKVAEPHRQISEIAGHAGVAQW